VFNNRADANHRYTTTRGARPDGVARRHREGYGGDVVIMCAPLALSRRSDGAQSVTLTKRYR